MLRPYLETSLSRSILFRIVAKITKLVSKSTLAETVEIIIQTSQFKNNQNSSKKPQSSSIFSSISKVSSKQAMTEAAFFTIGLYRLIGLRKYRPSAYTDTEADTIVRPYKCYSFSTGL